MPIAALRLRKSSAAGWTILDLPSPATIVCDHRSANTNDGTLVSQWNDRSGNGYHLTFSSSSRPFYNAAAINGYPALGADGGVTGGANGQYIAIGSNPPQNMYQAVTQGWMFAVYKLDGTSPTQARAVCCAETNGLGVTRLGIFSDSTAGAGKPNLRVRRLDADSVAVLAGPSSLADGNYHMVLGWMNWATREGRLYVDGNSPTTNATLTTAGSTSNTTSSSIEALGVRSNTTVINGKVAVADYGTTLPSDADVDRIFGYYAHELGLTSNLPVGHPYKTSPP